MGGTVAIGGGVAVLSFLLSWALGHGVQKLGIDDAPDGVRKLQDEPVSRLGGVSIAVATCITLLILIAAATMQGDPATISLTVLAATVAAFFAGLLDDLMDLPASVKLLLLLVAFIALAAVGLTPQSLTSPFGETSLPAVLIIGSAAWLLVFTNAVNFMDGSNGLAIGSLAIMLTALAFIGTDAGVFAFSLWWFALFGAMGGFLIHNLRGKLYAGDAGALGLGALFASLAVVSGLSVWTVATLALPFLIDVLMTLIWRARRGRSWLKAHLDHAYQRLRASGWGHFETAFLYWGLSAAGAVAAYIAAKAGGEAPFIVFWALCLAGIVLWGLHRRALRLSDEDA